MKPAYYRDPGMVQSPPSGDAGGHLGWRHKSSSTIPEFKVYRPQNLVPTGTELLSYGQTLFHAVGSSIEAGTSC